MEDGGSILFELKLQENDIEYCELTRSSIWPTGSENIALSTIHSAKGLEFDHVLMPGLNQEVTPHGIRGWRWDFRSVKEVVGCRDRSCQKICDSWLQTRGAIQAHRVLWSIYSRLCGRDIMALAYNSEAQPRTPHEIVQLANYPEIVEAAKDRGIRDVVHFTTHRGVIGILAANALKSRARLEDDKYLEHVYHPNVPVRKDPEWEDYVSLSISRINDWMFDSSNRWHVRDNNPWVVLSFSPEVLGHKGVVFTTTNNIYPSCRRREGLEGFERLFANIVRGRFGEIHIRGVKPQDHTTDRQAEVLYPGELSCDYLQRIDVQLESTEEAIHGILAGLMCDVPVRHAPEEFL